MEEAGGEDLFDKLGSGMGGAEKEAAGNGERPRQEDTSEPIQLVEDAANDLFDSLGVEHYDPTTDHVEPSRDSSEGQELEQLDTPVAGIATGGVSATDTTPVLKQDPEATEEAQKASETTPTLDTTSAAIESTTEASTTDASDVFDTIDTSDPIDQVSEPARTSGAGATDAETMGEPAAEASDVFDTIDTSGPIDQPSSTSIELTSPAAANTGEGGIPLEDDGNEDDVFATLASGDDLQGPETTNQTEDSAPATHHVASTIELVETEHDSIFDTLGTANEEPAASTIELVGTEHDSIFDNLGTTEQTEGPADSGDSVEEQERKYRLLLEEFGGEGQEFLPEPSGTHQAAALFGEEESTPFDELEPEYLQTASSSTTPPPDLSIENSLQDIEPYEGDMSMVTETSDWLKDSSSNDQSFQNQIGADASSPVDFEVPYGWYEGDTFHYYTDEQREQVRLAMLESQPQESTSQSQGRSSPPCRIIELIGR